MELVPYNNFLLYPCMDVLPKIDVEEFKYIKDSI